MANRLSSKSSAAKSPVRRSPPERPEPLPIWIPKAGAAFGAATLLFLMALVVAALFGHQIPTESRFLVVIALSFGAAMSAGFLGGTAAAKGTIPLPGPFKNTIAASTTGGVAVLVIGLAIGYYPYAKPASAARSQIIVTLPSAITDALQVTGNVTPESIADVGEVETIGKRQFLYVEFLPGKSSGAVRLKYLRYPGPAPEEAVYDVEADGKLTKRAQN
jgi:hypothetical protein